MLAQNRELEYVSPETVEKPEVMVIIMYSWPLGPPHSHGSWKGVRGVKCQAGQVHFWCAVSFWE